MLPKRFYRISGPIRQQGPNRDSRITAYLKFDPILSGPSLLLTPESKPTVDDFVELDEGLKELLVGPGLAKVVTEEGGELPEAVQATTSDHIKQFIRREGDGCRLNCARPVAQRSDQHVRLADVAHTSTVYQMSDQGST